MFPILFAALKRLSIKESFTVIHRTTHGYVVPEKAPTSQYIATA